GTTDQIERLDRLVDSILESVRVVPDRPPELYTIDLAPLVDDLLNDLGPLLAQHRLRIGGSRGLFVMADRGRLRQVLEHLLENAVKYAPPDSAIEVTWRLDEGVVRVEITDDGPGIPPE